MRGKTRKAIDYRVVELDGVRYVIMREAVFDRLCERANVSTNSAAAAGPSPEPAMDIDGASLAEKLTRRRLAARLSQAELRGARACGRRRSTALSAATPRPISPRSANWLWPWTRPSGSSWKSPFSDH